MVWPEWCSSVLYIYIYWYEGDALISCNGLWSNGFKNKKLDARASLLLILLIFFNMSFIPMASAANEHWYCGYSLCCVNQNMHSSSLGVCVSLLRCSWIILRIYTCIHTYINSCTQICTHTGHYITQIYAHRYTHIYTQFCKDLLLIVR